MKFILQTILILIITAVAETFIPWWSLIIVSFFVAFFVYSSRSSSFFSGFLGVGLLWFAYALYIDVNTGSMLTQKIAQIFKLPNSFLLLIITSLLGGITAGFSALSGNLFRELFTRKEYKG